MTTSIIQPPAAARPSPPKEKSAGLICPNCAGVVPVAEGTRIVKCPYCGHHSLVQGDRGIRRWHVPRRIDRVAAETAMRGFLKGMRKASDLSRTAKIEETLLIYLPFWNVESTVAGWLFGRVRKDKDETKPDEHYVFESMQWNDAAVDVTEFGVHHIVLQRDDLRPFDSQALHAEAMVFEPTESQTEAMDEARSHFVYRSRSQAGQTRTTYENIQLLRPEFTLVYYPVWLIRYSYRNRIYQTTIDGVHGRVMYGKAPGNVMYRAAALVAGLATGNLVLVNGTILAAMSSSDSDDNGLGLLLAPIVIGIALILYGYRQFRYGEEVEDKPREYRKAVIAPDKGLLGDILEGPGGMFGMAKKSIVLMEEIKELSKSGEPKG